MLTEATTEARRRKAPGDISTDELAELRRVVDLRARLLTTCEVAALASFRSVQSVQRAVRIGLLPMLKLNGRVVRFEPADVERYLKSARVA